MEDMQFNPVIFQNPIAMKNPTLDGLLVRPTAILLWLLSKDNKSPLVVELEVPN